MLRPYSWLALLVLLSGPVAFAQSPQLSMREFASGQVKKGVRSIGFGGDGATWGNYGLVYREHDTAIADAGVTLFTNGNTFAFTAVGVTTPALWRGLAIYVLGLTQTAKDVGVSLRDPAFGPAAFDARGDGGDELVAVRAAMPLGHGVSLGIQLTYEISHFDAILNDQRGGIRYHTQWRPSGGFGLAWTPSSRILIGTRVILNHDLERRVSPTGVRTGLYRNYEFRVGISVSPWKGGLIDIGGTMLDRANGIAGTESIISGANIGFEQELWKRNLVIRAGVDECELGFGSNCSATAGLSLKVRAVNLDLAYLYDLGQARVGTLFGEHSHSVLATLTLDYGVFSHRGARANVQ